METTTILLESPLSEARFAFLQQKWFALAQQLKLSASTSEYYFEKLVMHYNESHRAYHNLSHIYSMLVLLEQQQVPLERAAIVELAIWYHDVIYDPLQQDNELKSAQLVQRVFQDKLPEDDIRYCYQLILSTKKHEILIDNIDNQFVLDIDLAVLAADWQSYEAYTQAIRQEYSAYPLDLYNMGRQQAMQRFLERASIYFSTNFAALYEASARENIAKELELL